MNPIEIMFVTDRATADRYTQMGFEPIECSFGAEGSALGTLAMDHHGVESHREGVALRAYRDNFGARKSDPRFVVTGSADADATFAIASLAGVLPHPSRAVELEKAPPPVKAAGIRDISALAALVNLIDTAPIGVRLEETEDGVTLLLWNQMGSSSRDATAFHAGVDRWRTLTAGRPLTALLTATKAEEASRVVKAREAKVTKVTEEVALVESEVWGFDVWYADHAPVIVAFVAAGANVTIGVRDAETSEKFFGSGGLKNVFAKLQPQGWGGREAIGGSPRGAKLTREDALAAAKVVAESVIS